MLFPLPEICIYFFTGPTHIHGSNLSLGVTSSRKPLFLPPRLDLAIQTFVLLVLYFSFVYLSPLLCNCLCGMIVSQYWTSVMLVASQRILNALPMSEDLAPGCRPSPR